MVDKKVYKEYLTDYDKHFEHSGFGTKAIHSGQEPDFLNGCLSVPISLSSTYKQHEPSNPYGEYDYSRCGNPTRNNLERLIGSLEEGKYSIAFSSGCAATTSISMLCNTGDHILSIDDVYGGTQRIFRRILSPNNFEFTFHDDMKTVRKEIKSNTKMVWVESPTNPTLKVTDMEDLVKTVREVNKDIIIVCDNTFLTPYNYKPLNHGVDIVVESATKYLGGHSDVVMGVMSTNREDLHSKVLFIAKTIGGNPSPFDCFMVIRGIKTLHLRVERTNSNGLQVAKYLSNHPKIKKVNYAGLESSPYYEIAKKNGYKGNGGMIGFYPDTDYEGVKRFFKTLKVFTLAESLGAVESLVEHPKTMTHASVPNDVREKLGITDTFIRMSVGCEDIEDLINDLEEALKVV